EVEFGGQAGLFDIVTIARCAVEMADAAVVTEQRNVRIAPEEMGRRPDGGSAFLAADEAVGLEPEALAHRHAQRGGRKTGGSIFYGAAGRLDLAVDAGNRGQLTGIGRGRKKRSRRTRRNGSGISGIFGRC